MQYDVVIVGAGPAGMTAAIYAARANLKVLLLDKLAPGGQIVNTYEIQNYTGLGTINGAELAIKMYEHTQELGVAFEYSTVQKIVDEGKYKRIICEEGQEHKALAIILATGTIPQKLGIAGEERFAGESISWCAICDGPHYRDRDVAVIGGGNSAVEEAIYLAGIAKSVTLVTLFDLTADCTACDKLRAQENVVIHIYHTVEEFLGENKFTGLRVKSTQTGQETLISCDGAFEYIGLKPTSADFRDLAILNEQGYVLVDNHMQTKVPGIFGAGDVTAKHLRQVITAAADGAIAAQAAAKYIEQL